MNKILKWILIIVGIIFALIIGVLAYDYFFYPQVNNDYNPFDLPVVKKPAIYLYPLKDSFVNVQLNINGEIIKDIPDYNSGWTVFVSNSGIIDNKYDYLFYEAKLNKLDLPEEGWVVSYDELDNWMEIKSDELGLNEKEKMQFKEYWLSELPKSKYYEIRLLSNEFLNENMGLDINPKPDTVIRIELYFKPINERINIREPILKTPERKGFVVVEWGGILSN